MSTPETPKLPNDFLGQLTITIMAMVQAACPTCRIDTPRTLDDPINIWCPCNGGIMKEIRAFSIYVDEPLSIVIYYQFTTLSRYFDLADPEFCTDFVQYVMDYYQLIAAQDFRMEYAK